MIDERAEAAMRRANRTFVAAIVASMLAVTAAAGVLPTSVTVLGPIPGGTDPYVAGDPLAGFGIMNVSPDLRVAAVWLAVFALVGALGWLVTERRLPRFRRGPEKLVMRLPIRVVPYSVAYVGARLLTELLRDWLGLRIPTIPGWWVSVESAWDAAVGWVLWSALFASIYLCMYALVVEMVAEWYPDEAPVRLVPRTPRQHASAPGGVPSD